MKSWAIFATLCFVFGLQAAAGGDKFSGQVGKTVSIEGLAITEGRGPALKLARSPGRKIFVVDPKPPQKFKQVSGNAETLLAWPDEVEGKPIEVTGLLDLRHSPAGYTRSGDGKFIKYKKRPPDEYILKSASWK